MDQESAISKSSGKQRGAINIIIELCLLLPCTFLNTHNRLQTAKNKQTGKENKNLFFFFLFGVDSVPNVTAVILSSCFIFVSFSLVGIFTKAFPRREPGAVLMSLTGSQLRSFLWWLYR